MNYHEAMAGLRKHFSFISSVYLKSFHESLNSIKQNIALLENLQDLDEKISDLSNIMTKVELSVKMLKEQAELLINTHIECEQLQLYFVSLGPLAQPTQTEKITPTIEGFGKHYKSKTIPVAEVNNLQHITVSDAMKMVREGYKKTNGSYNENK